MGMTFSSGGGGGDFANLKPGTYPAVCNMLADIGLQPGTQRYPDPKHKIIIRFEVPSERIEDQEGSNGDATGPMTINGWFTASMNSKANLRKFLEGWRGKAFTDMEAAQFDIAKLLGVACMLNVTGYTKQDGTTATKISTASPLMKGVEAPTAENELLLYAPPDDTDSLAKLPEWIQQRINEQVGSDTPVAQDDSSDVPF